MFTRLFIKKGIYSLCIKYPHSLPPECTCVLQAMEPDEWSDFIVCRQDGKVEFNSGHLKKGPAKFTKN